MEVYRNSSNAQVMLPAPNSVFPVEDDIVVRAVRDGEVVYTFTEVYRVNEGFSVVLPWSLVREDGEFFIEWEFDYLEGTTTEKVTSRTQVNVVTAVLPLSEVKRISAFEDDADVRDIERKVRYTIQSFTGQNFGKYKATYRVQNPRVGTLTLPAPLLTLGTVNGYSIIPTSVDIFNDGWAVTYGNGAYNIKQDLIEYSTGAIVVPGVGSFSNNHVYVNGTWGFYDVPDAVQEAARILISDYSCDESLWRERYITSIRAADWRFDFSAEATMGTGNVVADQLLSDYRKKSMAVI